MKKLFFLLVIIISLSLIISACDDNDDNTQISYSGQWVRANYVFNGSIGIDTITIVHTGDSLLMSDSYFPTAFIKADTAYIVNSNSLNVHYFVIQSKNRFRSNYPINRTIDSIVLTKIN